MGSLKRNRLWSYGWVWVHVVYRRKLFDMHFIDVIVFQSHRNLCGTTQVNYLTIPVQNGVYGIFSSRSHTKKIRIHCSLWALSVYNLWVV